MHGQQNIKKLLVIFYSQAEKRRFGNFWILTLIPLTWRIWWAPKNGNKWQMGFNSAFKGLSVSGRYVPLRKVWCYVRCAVVTGAGTRAFVATGVVSWGKVVALILKGIQSGRGFIIFINRLYCRFSKRRKPVAYPGILFGGFNKFSWGQRTERTGIWGL